MNDQDPTPELSLMTDADVQKLIADGIEAAAVLHDAMHGIREPFSSDASREMVRLIIAAASVHTAHELRKAGYLSKPQP